MTDRQKQLIVYGLEQQKKQYCNQVHTLLSKKASGKRYKGLDQELELANLMADEFTNLVEEIAVGTVL